MLELEQKVENDFAGRIKGVVKTGIQMLGLGALVSGCLIAAAAGAGSYAGSKMAQDKSGNVQITSEWVELGQGTLRFGRAETLKTYCSGDCVLFNGGAYLIRNPYNCKDITMGWTRVKEWKNSPQVLIVNANQKDAYGEPVEFRMFGDCK